ncbi:hypothetical protein, conserved [Eimeria tenella]|uniref:Uncharacterized protein n=1 Tax=Eimeria tenella TaxID=5802 RepID=U6KV28_EIMTE|nr:hypothetical protein, conserved [Eimeria tenella]CDJ41826.1 hypothetical protein, conserved [Eimeria tenella]|eukprot:XP_013232576.1 hypothetical protein, conserved [Eimeria tenella]
MAVYAGIRFVLARNLILLTFCTLATATEFRRLGSAGSVETNEAQPPTKIEPHLPETSSDAALYSIIAASEDEEQYETQQNYPPGCFVNGQNRCRDAPITGVRDYLRSLALRLSAVSSVGIDYNDRRLVDALDKLGCMNVAVIDLDEVQVTVGLVRQMMLSRVRIDKQQLHDFSSKCNNQLLPLSFHQHERAVDLMSRGHLNIDKSCEAERTGGHHDPGFACGPTGASACKNLNIPGSSALEGTSLFTGQYNCNPSIYAHRPFACHAGDLSGKLGSGTNVSTDSNRPDLRLIAFDSHADNSCVASEKKQSLVLHCQSTNYRIACAPFQRVETAGRRMVTLLREVIKAAVLAIPHSTEHRSVFASLVLLNELEKRIAILEKAANIRRPNQGPNPFPPADTDESEHLARMVD